MVSIITSLYQSDQYLPAYEKHLKAFTRHLIALRFEFEIIVIANDPTEREKKFRQAFKNEPWFRFVSVAREPLYATWNRGVELAKGRAIGFWNVDDTRYPQAITEAYQLLQAGAELVYFPFKIDRYIKFLGRYFLIHKQLINSAIPEFNTTTRKEFQRSMVCGPFFMFSKELYVKVGPFDEQFKIAGDFDWCIRAAKVSDKFVKAKSLAGEFRVDGGGLSAGSNERLVEENNTVYRRHGVADKIAATSGALSAQYDFTMIKQGNRILPYV